MSRLAAAAKMIVLKFLLALRKKETRRYFAQYLQGTVLDA